MASADKWNSGVFDFIIMHTTLPHADLLERMRDLILEVFSIVATDKGGEVAIMLGGKGVSKTNERHGLVCWDPTMKTFDDKEVTLVRACDFLSEFEFFVQYVFVTFGGYTDNV